MKKHENYFDFMLCTIPESFDINPYILLLAIAGYLITAGLPGPNKAPVNNMEV